MKTLKDLSDEELKDYYNIIKKLNKRHLATLEYGVDVKFAYHCVRLLNEVEQILIEGDLDLMRNREQLKSIRRGEWERGQIFEYFTEKEKQLEELYVKSELPHSPDKDKIRSLLVECLEMHYDLSEYKDHKSEAEQKLEEIRKIIG